MIQHDQLFVGLRLRDLQRTLGSQILIVTKVLEQGFYYIWAEQQHFGPRYGYTDGGLRYQSGYESLELADPDQHDFKKPGGREHQLFGATD
mgnify:CR=1 FL=1